MTTLEHVQSTFIRAYKTALLALNIKILVTGLNTPLVSVEGMCICYVMENVD